MESLWRGKKSSLHSGDRRSLLYFTSQVSQDSTVESRLNGRLLLHRSIVACVNLETRFHTKYGGTDDTASACRDRLVENRRRCPVVAKVTPSAKTKSAAVFQSAGTTPPLFTPLIEIFASTPSFRAFRRVSYLLFIEIPSLHSQTKRSPPLASVGVSGAREADNLAARARVCVAEICICIRNAVEPTSSSAIS